jgi:hypothetical protein
VGWLSARCVTGYGVWATCIDVLTHLKADEPAVGTFRRFG